ncbi:MAG TPA: hypothetical protein VGB50_10455 [Flavobacterium sp.]
MKKLIRTGVTLLIATTLTLVFSCKNNSTTAGELPGEPENTNTETTGMDPDGTGTEPETAETLNDTNASGTTGGEMEQVP